MDRKLTKERDPREVAIRTKRKQMPTVVEIRKQPQRSPQPPPPTSAGGPGRMSNIPNSTGKVRPGTWGIFR